MVQLTSRTIRNCTMNNSVFCHCGGFLFCFYNSELFLPSPFLLSKNPRWRGNLQRLPAPLTCRWHFQRASRMSPAGSMLTARTWDLCAVQVLATLTQMQYIRGGFSVKLWCVIFFFFLIAYIV